MKYLTNFYLQSDDMELDYFRSFTRTCFTNCYPYRFFPNMKGLTELSFDDITILCGSNGAGKSTLLNIIAEKLELKRDTEYNKTYFFNPYVESCHFNLDIFDKEVMRDFRSASRIISSDDVFNSIIRVRKKNENLDFKRELIFNERHEYDDVVTKNPTGFNADAPESIQAYVDYYDRLRLSASQYVKRKIGEEERTYSNGENGFRYFTDAIQPGGLYLLDEPENSLSPEMQLQLTKFLYSMARFYKCQFIIATHSPFILSIPHARIYNMDETPVKTCKWTEYENVRVYYDFFKHHSDEFEN